MQGNWGDFAYPTAFVLISWYACEKIASGKKIVAAGIVLSIAMLALFLSIPFIQSHNILNDHPISYKVNPFKPIIIN